MTNSLYDTLPSSTAMERMLSETEARHYLCHTAPARAELPKPDKITRAGHPKWFVSTILKLTPDARVDWDLRRCDDRRDLFFSDVAADVANAKSVCYRCPLQQACVRTVLSMPVRQAGYGVWGGTSAEERLAWRNKL
jgi:Transcription factor WhiB